MGSFPGLDQRLLELINGPGSPYHHFHNYPPYTHVDAYEPTSLDFLYLIEGFHLGQMPSYRFSRTPTLYNVLVNRFTKLTVDIGYLLAHVMYNRLFLDPRLLGYSEKLRVKALYSRYNVHPDYPTSNLLDRLYTTVTLIRICPVPRMQRFNFRTVHPEIVRMIAKNLTHKDMRNFAGASRFVRKACEEWVHMRATFDIEYDHNATRASTRSTARYLDRVHDAIDHAITASLRSMWAFFNHPAALQGARLLTFDNQWERFLPANSNVGPPNPLDVSLYRPLHNAIVTVLQNTQPAHLRLMSIGITREVFTAIHEKSTLTHLTLHECTPDRFTLNRHYAALDCEMHLSNLRYLVIGFSRYVPNNKRCWEILQFCFQLRHFYAYTADNSTTIVLPDRDVYANIAHLHTLERFHIDGASSCTAPLLDWFQVAAQRYTGYSRGSLTHLKLHTRHGMCTDDLMRLLHALSILHPGIRVLVLAGVTDTTRVIRAISRDFPRLESLGLFRVLHEDQLRLRLCQWELPTYAYAIMLAALPRLRHFQANFDYTPLTFAPSAFSACVYPGHLDPLYDCATQNADHYIDRDVLYKDNPATYDEIKTRLDRADSLGDGRAIALPFAAYCHALPSFAIKADITHFSCMVSHKHGGKYLIYNIIDHQTIGGFEDWNPPQRSTWPDSTTAVV